MAVVPTAEKRWWPNVVQSLRPRADAARQLRPSPWIYPISIFKIYPKLEPCAPWVYGNFGFLYFSAAIMGVRGRGLDDTGQLSTNGGFGEYG